MLLKSEVKIGEIYGYDVKCDCSSINLCTKTVKILEINEVPEQRFMGDFSPAYTSLIVECQQTGDLFTCGIHMLTTIERIKKMYDGYKNAVTEQTDELYSYNKTIKKLEDILFQLDVNKILLVQ